MTDNRMVLLLVCLVSLSMVAPAALAGDATAAAGCSFPVTKTDATGTQVTIDQKPATIVTLGPSAAQTMWEIGGKSQVVAVSTNAGYLSGTSSLPKIANIPVDTESVVAQSPDLVLAPAVVDDDDVDILRDAGLTVYHAHEAQTIEDVYSKTLAIGRLTGNCDGAESTVAWMREEIGEIRDVVQGRERPRTFYHLGGGWTAGDDTFINELFEAAGAENVAPQEGISGYEIMSAEVIVQTDPEWIVRGDNAFAAVPKDQLPYSATTAVKDDQIVVVDDDYINQPAPRIVFIIETIAEALHPDVEIDVGSGGANADLTTREPEIEQTVAADGGVSLAVSDLYEKRRVNFTLPGGGTTADGGVSVAAVNLSLATPNPAFELRVTPGPQLPDDRSSVSDTVFLGAFSVTPNGILDEGIQNVRFRFGIPRDKLSAVDADPGSVTLYRYSDGAWTRLETRLVGQTTTEFDYEARSPGTSIFAVGVPQQSLPIQDAAIETARVRAGEPIVASATVRNPSVAEVTVPVSLSVGGTVLATRDVTVPANETRTVRVQATLSEPGTHAVSVGTRSLGEVTVTAPETELSESSSAPEQAAEPAQRSETPNPPDPTATTETIIHGTGQAGFGFGAALFALVGTLMAAARIRGECR